MPLEQRHHPGGIVDVFALREALIEDYKSFSGSFVQPRDEQIKAFLERRLVTSEQWPDPWLSVNPNFATGGTPAELINEGLLHAGCEEIFRIKNTPTDPGHNPIVFHRHQRDAIVAARSGQSYVLTTGTGSGKSLAYIVPIVDHVLRSRDEAEPGVKAIVVYPMNALANSQMEELRKFLHYGFAESERPVTFERYTGQEGPDERRRILANPPDILLTNYVMLDLVLTRPDERQHLITAARRSLRYLVLDELHTYRGRQGADVAMLVRRVRDVCESPDLQVVGTSATMASGGTTVDRRRVVAQVATKMFGTHVSPDRVIDESLVRATRETETTSDELRARVASITQGENLNVDYETLSRDPLAIWIENSFGLSTEEATGVLVRGAPARLPEAADRLAGIIKGDASTCRLALERLLLAGSAALDPVNRRPLFAFRLHQFVSKGENVYASLEAPGIRHLTGQYQLRVPGEADKALLPLGFCRECGQEYYVVARIERDGQVLFVPRSDRDASGGDNITGYLYVSDEHPWPSDPVAEGRLPDHWLVANDDGSQSIAPNKAKYQPQVVYMAADGTVLGHDEGGMQGWFISTPFAFCLHCRVSYEQVRGNDFSKLATLDQEGRSSAVTVLSGATVRGLRRYGQDLPESARKLLTFVDNRQDASLQSGHFNDFAQVAQLRSAIYRAVSDAAGGLRHETVAHTVTAALGLEPADYAENPGAARFSAGREKLDRALREVVQYRLYVDLKRGWRVTMPNLEQVGLLRVDYVDLAEVAADGESWAQANPRLATSIPKLREELARIVLDECRRVLAIDVDCLTEPGFDRVKAQSRQELRDPWRMADNDRLEQIGTVFARKGSPGQYRSDLNFSGRSTFGRYLRSPNVFGSGLKSDDAQDVIASLLRVLYDVGVLNRVATDQAGNHGYRLRASSILWRAGDGTGGAVDLLRVQLDSEATRRVNPFFRDLYRESGLDLAGLYAREHTAQVSPNVREEREGEFREGRLKLLYCSPTMELGVDIKELSAVGLRNIPPTPANYAQRSGRAGRQGQPAIVTTYCASGNAHDNYWFRRSDQMVSGSVSPPRLDLGNEELVRSHVQAIWLAETGKSMGSSLTEVLDMAGERPSLELLPEVWLELTDTDAKRRAQLRAERLLDELRQSWGEGDNPIGWWHDGWVAETVERAPTNLDRAIERWRDLYRASRTEYEEQSKLAVAPGASWAQHERAVAREREARDRIRLLTNDVGDMAQSDFYSYRYLASEGFLPGYSFPRLPLAAYVPGSRGRERDGSYLQRPRFVAIREFGPGSLIYHEGARYEVTSVELPRGAEGSPGVETEDARRCTSCGYHHPVQAGTDVCENCGVRLGAKTHNLLRLQTVHTRRRERISSDEEERRRSGFEVEVSYRFATHGDRAGKIDAEVTTEGKAIAELVYGDSATLRLTNIGRRRRKDPGDVGFWLDTINGRWLSEKQAADTPVDDDLDDAEDVPSRKKVIPYVTDTRNILLYRAAERLTNVEATTLRYALERAIETEFQLEDSELDSVELPDEDERGRMLFTESAEGGAGVLRRLVSESGAMGRVGRRALDLLHFDPETGEDLGHAPESSERCEKGCYACLLSYSNQPDHAWIDRGTVKDALIMLATAATGSGGGGRSRDDTVAVLHAASDSSLERSFVDWLRDHGLRLPDRAQVTVEAARARPDFVFDLPSGPVAVFVDGPHHDFEAQQVKDRAASDRLYELGWDVVRIPVHESEWLNVIRRHPGTFGSPIGPDL